MCYKTNQQNKTNSLNRYSQPIILNNVKMIKNKSLPTWKQYRWAKWAMENNIIKQHGTYKINNNTNFKITQNQYSNKLMIN